MNTKQEQCIKKIADNLADYEAIMETTSKDGYSNSGTFERATLCNGFPGICMLFGKMMELYPGEEKWEEAANRYLGYTVEELNKTGIDDISMFTGIAGVGLAAAAISDNFTNYTQLLGTINESITYYLPHLMSEMAKMSGGMYASAYDVIAGITGIMNYLDLFKRDNLCYDVLQQGLDVLIYLSQQERLCETDLMKYYISSENQFSSIESSLYPEGCINLGLAHGIAGPLILLSKCKINGICGQDQDEAIKRIVQVYRTYYLEEKGRIVWKGQVEPNEIRNKCANRENFFHRDAWCYGNPGISYALACAAVALEDTELKNFAIEILKKTTQDIQGIFSPTFCHGYAGIYQIICSMERLTKTDRLSEEKETIQNKIWEFYAEDYAYGFHNIDIDKKRTSLQEFETIGFLDGSAGTCLSLLSSSGDGADMWKRAFML